LSPLIREGTIIYSDVTFGENFTTGHLALIRGPTKMGDNVLVGSGTIIEGDCIIGDNVRIQSKVFIPRGVEIGNNVFIGPCVVMANDKYPLGSVSKTKICDNVTIGANATLLPGITLGKYSFVAAGALVTKDVPEYKMAIGHPAKITEPPEQMKKRIPKYD
jgi:acetyltransferase-like isoleucine patch superfamily enzyme